MRPITTTIALALFLLLPFPAQAADTTSNDGWRVSHAAKAPDFITTWKKSLPGKSLDAFKGEITVPHSMLTVLAVMADLANYPTWVFQCDSAEFLPKLGPNIAYMYINGIWPVSDRDAVLRNTLKQDPTSLAVTIHTVATPRLMPEKDGVVRMPALDNYFVLTPLSPTETRITFTTFADPGGMIPAWLANFVAVSAPFDTLRDMKKRMALPQYQITRIEQLPMLLPGAENIQLPH